MVLEDVTLAFEQGRLSGIMGPIGAGKTTCFNVSTGRYRPDRGKSPSMAKDITGLAPHAIARSSQLMNLFDDYSALENVVLALPEVRRRALDCWRPLLDDEACGRAMQVLRDVGLAGRALEPARRLAYGERRALEIGLALAARPKILFLDEPTAGLGMAGTAQLIDLVLALKQRYTMVIIEHDMRFLFRLADTISVIHWGQVIAQGTPAELRADPWAAASEIGAS
jgi:branched-chain amino acid transport system ATP-binding protein